MQPTAKDILTATAHRLTTTLMASALCIGAYATEPSDSVAVKLRDISVTARQTPVKITTAAPVQTLNVETISRLGIQNMADAVRRFAGTTVRDYGGIGGLKTVSVRNMGASHTAVSYDGAPVSNCQGGQIDIGRFSLDNVSTVSLAIGNADDMLAPASLRGAAAVVGITTLSPRFEDGRTNTFRVGMKGGSFGFVNPSLRWWTRVGSSTTAALEGDYMRADGNYPYTLHNGILTGRHRRNNSFIHSWHAEANVRHSFSETSHLGVKAYLYNSHRGLPGAVTLYNPVSTETLRDRNAFVQANWRAEMGDKFAVQAIAKYNYGWNRDREKSPQYAGGIYQDTHRQDEYYLSASGLYRSSSFLTLSLAQDVAVNTLESTLGACPFPRRVSSLTALAARWRRGPVTANASLLGTFITEHVKSGRAPADIKRINPAAAVSVQPWSEKQLYIRAMYKSSLRVPSFNDLYYERSGNRVLRPERANEFDLGATWSARLFPIMDYLAITVDGYYNLVNDKIVAFPSPYVWKTVNYGRVKAHGIDITAATAFSLPGGMGLELSGAYSWQRSRNLADPSAKEFGGQLPYTPINSGNIAAIVTSPWATLGYSAVAVGKRYYMAQNIPANEIRGYVEQALTLSRSFAIGRTKLDVRAELINLGNISYEVIKYYPMPGRSWRLVAYYRF